MALFYTQNRGDSSTFLHDKIVVKIVLFCIISFHLLGDDCQSIPIFFFYNFSKILLDEISQRYESLFFHLFAY
jgi:hypothetical protein